MERLDLEALITKWEGDRSYLIEMLQDIQSHYNYLPREVIEELCTRLNVPITEVYHVATFFSAFSLEPKGRNIVQVCTGTACHVKGAPRIIDGLERELGLKPGETDKQLEFTVEAVRCIGCCGLAAVVVVNDDVHGAIRASSVPKLVAHYRNSGS